MELENVPSWLEIPLTYYPTLGKDLCLELYQMIAKDKVDERTYKVVSTILQFLQLSTVMLDDISRGVEERAGKKAIHLEHGLRNVALWALGISHYTYKILADNISPDEHSFKYIQVYNDLGTRGTNFDSSELKSVETLRMKLEEQQEKKDFRKTFERNPACYVASFPVALFALEKAEEVNRALRLIEDYDLIEFGYLLQAEKEFIDFHTEHNKDIEMQNWTILIHYLSKAMGKDFKYPKSKKEAIELLEKHNIYDQYLRERDLGIQGLKYALKSMEMSRLKGVGSVELFEAKKKVLQTCLDYFDSIMYKSKTGGRGSQKALSETEVGEVVEARAKAARVNYESSKPKVSFIAEETEPETYDFEKDLDEILNPKDEKDVMDEKVDE